MRNRKQIVLDMSTLTCMFTGSFRWTIFETPCCQFPNDCYIETANGTCKSTDANNDGLGCNLHVHIRVVVVSNSIFLLGSVFVDYECNVYLHSCEDPISEYKLSK